MEDRLTCPGCQATVSKTDRFCPGCGRDLDAAVVDGPQQTPSRAPTRAEQAQADLLAELKEATAGRFEIIRELGLGGMSVVYLARELSLNRQVAIKVLSPAVVNAPGVAERFLLEAQTIARLSHPNIIPIHQIHNAGSLVFFVMKFVDGPSLRHVIEKHQGPMPYGFAHDLLNQIGRGLDHAHSFGIVHRDVKPSNVLVGLDGTAVITDFGIAKVTDIDEGLTKSGSILGTPTYMSPEQVRSQDIGSASDQYSLGVIAFEMLAGRPPFTGESSIEIAYKHAQEAPPSLASLRPDCPSGVSDAIERMLAKEPEARWPSIGDALAGLSALGTAVSSDAGGSKKEEVLAEWLKPGPSEGSADSTLVAPDQWEPEPETGEAKETEQGESTQILIVRGHSDKPEAPPLSVALTITTARDPGALGRRVPCDHFPFVVGRGAGADLTIVGDQTLSRKHLEIVRDEDGFAIRDFSRNGIFVNGRRVGRDGEPLFFGASIVLSEFTRLAFAADVPELPDLTGNELGRYRLGKAIHQSIKATTYLAEDTRLARQLALKIFSPVLMQLGHYRAEFRKQAELAARLLHPHICKILDYGDTTLTVKGATLETSYLCMEYMGGGNLSSRLEQDRTPPLETVVAWVRALAGALDHAHRNGVYHGDLKPDCIVFDQDGVPYLTDFALATTDDGSSRGALFGTPAYLAPERWDGTPPSPAADQYSLAALAYLLVTGTRPHEGQSDPDVRRRNFARGPMPAHEEAAHAGRDDISPTLSAVLEKGLHADPDKRYASVVEFEAALVDAVNRPGAGLQPRVFMSYQREASAGWANLFANTLEGKHDWSIFLDTMARDGAPQIPERIRNAIEQADVFVCFLAPGTLESSWVRQEIAIAHESRKPMVPVFHEAFRREEETRIDEPGVEALLDFDAVHLFDRRNIHVSHSIDDLGKRIQRLL